MDALFSQRSEDIRCMVEAIESAVGTTLRQDEKKRIVFASRGLDIERFRSMWAKRRLFEFEAAHITPQTNESERARLLGAFTALVRGVSDDTPPEVTDPKSLIDEWRSLPDPEQLSRLLSVAQPREPHPPNIVSVENSLDYAIKHLFEKKQRSQGSRNLVLCLGARTWRSVGSGGIETSHAETC